MTRPQNSFRYLFSTEDGLPNYLLARWLFLRALGLIYFSAFFSLLFQIRGLIGPGGILPAGEYLADLARSLPGARHLWLAPTLLWFSSGNHALMALSWIGLLASVLVTVNLWPRLALLLCFACFLSFVAAASDFSSYQSDGMLLEAGFLSLFLAPRGLLPGLGCTSLPSRAAHFLLLWEWFRIYFQSGVVKLLSGDTQWRHLTALDEYYQNGPLPTWIGWYVQHLPHGFHEATVIITFVLELFLVWMLFLPRRFRTVCFFLVTVWQIGVILTANYAFLNYLVLILAFLLLDDRFLAPLVPTHWLARDHPERKLESSVDASASPPTRSTSETISLPSTSPVARPPAGHHHLAAVRLAFTAVMLTWIAYATTVPLVRMFWRTAPLSTAPLTLLDTFRIANQYGLFAVMTPHRYEIEFQGSNDGVTWLPYRFRYKPQDPAQRPGIYAPYQPRFDWNLWFASLGAWTDYSLVPRTEERLLEGEPDVLALFSGNPFPRVPPRFVRAVLYQYWFTDMPEMRLRGLWWRREFLGTYAPTLIRTPEGRFAVVDRPTLTAAPE